MKELYVLASVDKDGKITSFAKGGGSSTKPSIKAHDSLASAKRSQRHFPGAKIVKMTDWEVVG